MANQSGDVFARFRDTVERNALPSATNSSPKRPRSMSVLLELVLKELNGRLWHTTHPDRFSAIINSGGILPEPDISDRDRWKTSQGKEFYPYVRTIGGVSLFDFNNFDPESYGQKYPISSWRTFVPFRMEWGCSVWIEINRVQVAAQLISTTDLVAKWNSDRAYRHTIMPHIEAAHLGLLPRRAFTRAFLVGDGENQFHPLDI